MILESLQEISMLLVWAATIAVWLVIKGECPVCNEENEDDV
jgi:hypothetical protein